MVEISAVIVLRRPTFSPIRCARNGTDASPDQPGVVRLQGDKMRHSLPTGVERAERILHLPVRLGGPIVLPQMLRPRFHEKTLDAPMGVPRVHEQLPKHGAVAPPNRPHQTAQRGGKRVAVRGVERVFDGDEHGPRVGREGFRHHGVGPVVRGSVVTHTAARQLRPLTGFPSAVTQSG